MKGAVRKATKWAEGWCDVFRRGWGGSAALAEGARLNSGGIRAGGQRRRHNIERLETPRRSRDAARRTTSGIKAS